MDFLRLSSQRFRNHAFTRSLYLCSTLVRLLGVFGSACALLLAATFSPFASILMLEGLMARTVADCTDVEHPATAVTFLIWIVPFEANQTAVCSPPLALCTLACLSSGSHAAINSISVLCHKLTAEIPAFSCTLSSCPFQREGCDQGEISCF